jgi:dihydrofolate reductase
MRKIIVVTFSTMNGVLQAPGGREEDPANGFKWGGWQFGYPDEETDKVLGSIFSTSFDLLLGRKTYEIFSAYWPYQSDQIAAIFNHINKYVVATTPVDTSWEHSILINKDVVNELKKLKATDGPDLLVHGSSRLIQTLLANRLVDVLHLMIYPITLSKGKKLFEEGTQSQEWKIEESIVSKTGTIIVKYVPGGEVKTGSFGPDNPSDAEKERRKKWKQEENR